MRYSISRKGFLQQTVFAATGLALGAPLAGAVEPFRRPGRPRFRLSLAAYSFRQFFTHGNRNAPPEGKRIDLEQFIDFCADNHCDGTELTSYYFPPDVTPEYLLKLSRHAFLRGIEVSGTAVGNNFALPAGTKRDTEIGNVKKWIGHAAILGAPHIRIFAGAAQGISKEEAKKWCIEAIEECAAEAGKHGIFLGVENHGGIVAEPDDLLDIVQKVRSPWVGINLDTGNFNTADPYADLARCAPYSVNVQVKAEIRPRGQKAQEPDLARLVGILRQANYQGYVALEYESAADPWKAVPEWLKRMQTAFAAA